MIQIIFSNLQEITKSDSLLSLVDLSTFLLAMVSKWGVPEIMKLPVEDTMGNASLKKVYQETNSTDLEHFFRNRAKCKVLEKSAED